MSHIEFQNDAQYEIDESALRRAIQTVIDQHEVDAESGVTVVFTTNDDVHQLNKNHRDVDAPTDILSFPAEPLPPELAEHETPYLGDLIVAYPYAKSQAEQLKHPLDDSLILLVIHGTLHLLSYDHDTPANRATMWSAQAKILKILGISDEIVPALEESDHA